MTRIVLVGAGSVEFTRNLLGDILSFPALRDAELVLHDIDPERLRTAERMATWTAATLGAEPSISAELDRRDRPRRRRLRDQHDPGRRRPGHPGRLRHPRPVRPAVHDQRHHRRRRRAPGPAHDPGRRWGSPPTWTTPAPTPRCSTTRTRWGCSSGRWTRPSACRWSASATPCTGPWTRSPGTWACRPPRLTRPVGRRQPPGLDPAPGAPRPGPLPGPRGVRGGRQGPRRRPGAGGPVPRGSGSTPRSPPSTTPSTTRGSSPRARSRRSTSRSASTSRGSPTTSTSTPRRSAASTPASRSRSSAAASTRP